MLHFDCEKCGKTFHVDDRFAGRKGRCRSCGHVARIAESVHAPPEVSAAPFRLSPAEERPWIGPKPASHHDAPQAEPEHAHPQHERHPHHDFELVDDDDAPVLAQPAAVRGLREIEDFQKNPRGYGLADGRAGLRSWFARDSSRPAGWLYVKWRAIVSMILNTLRFIDDWAYLISVPFLILMLFAIVISNRGLAQFGAVVVVIANYGRFWADLLALYVRPFKDGVIQGVAFLFPPYSLYYMFVHWERVRSTSRRIATSCIPIVLVLLAYAFVPAVNPEAAKLPDVPSKLKSAERELIKDVDTDLEEVGLPAPAKAGKPRGKDASRP